MEQKCFFFCATGMGIAFRMLMKVLALILVFITNAFAQDWGSIAFHNPPGTHQPELVYRGMGDKQYSVDDFIASVFLHQNKRHIMSRALIALIMGLEGKKYDPHYDLRSGPFEYNSKNIKALIQSVKRKKSKLTTTDLAVNELSRYIESLFSRPWGMIRELSLMTHPYEYEFGNGFLFFTKHYEIARLYGVNMAVVKEATPRGIDINAFHYYHHGTKAWQIGDTGEYVIPVGVHASEVLGLHFENSYFALYQKKFQGKNYLVYFDLRKIPSQCLVMHEEEFYYCSITPKSPGEAQLTVKASAQGILYLCNDDLNCDVPEGLKKEINLEETTVISSVLLKALTNHPQVKIITR